MWHHRGKKQSKENKNASTANNLNRGINQKHKFNLNQDYKKA